MNVVGKDKNMKKWEYLQKRISKMGKEEFFTLVNNGRYCKFMAKIFNEDVRCRFLVNDFSCADCKKEWLEEEYEEKNYIVHRTLRKKNKEIYILKKLIYFKVML